MWEKKAGGRRGNNKPHAWPALLVVVLCPVRAAAWQAMSTLWEHLLLPDYAIVAYIMWEAGRQKASTALQHGIVERTF